MCDQQEKHLEVSSSLDLFSFHDSIKWQIIIFHLNVMYNA